MLLAAGGAPLEMGSQAGHRGIRVEPRDLQLDVAVELCEALVAADLGPARAKQAGEGLLALGSLHHLSSRADNG